ncbi:hypothetical protein DZF79_04385 [Vibrio parahaemolyticus]|nr:hypothetical protein [Vibrio parahaemolyticus]
MGICLPPKEQMLSRLKEAMTDNRYIATSKLSDEQIGDIYHEVINIQEARQSAEKTFSKSTRDILKVVADETINDADLHFDYREILKGSNSRTFECALSLTNRATEEIHLLAGCTLETLSDGSLMVISSHTRDSSEELLYNALGMFAGLAKTNIVFRKDLVPEQADRIENSPLFISQIGKEQLSYTAIPSKEFFRAVSKSRPEATDAFSILSQIKIADMEKEDIDQFFPFNHKIPKRVMAAVEPFEATTPKPTNLKKNIPA